MAKRYYHPLKIGFLLIFGLLIFLGPVQWGAWTYLRSLLHRENVDTSHEDRRHDRRMGFPSERTPVILVHGLNFDASKLYPLGEHLAKLGHGVLVPRLAGHRQNLDETFLELQSTWTEQVQQWASSEPGTPWICAGYSLGAMLLLRAHARGDIQCTKFILFAPALFPRASAWAVWALKSIWPMQWTFPTAIPYGNAHFSRVGLGPTFSMFEILKTLPQELEQLKSPWPGGVVIMDPRDQLVDSEKVKAEITNRFPLMKMVWLNLPEEAIYQGFHGVADPVSVGPSSWKQVLKAVDETLAN